MTKCTYQLVQILDQERKCLYPLIKEGKRINDCNITICEGCPKFKAIEVGKKEVE